MDFHLFTPNTRESECYIEGPQGDADYLMEYCKRGEMSLNSLFENSSTVERACYAAVLLVNTEYTAVFLNGAVSATFRFWRARFGQLSTQGGICPSI
jgi:hypothetical protein